MTRARLVFFAAAGSLLLLAGAFEFQALGYAPCKLCLWQRWPHATAILIGVLALGLKGRLLPVLGACAAATTAAVGLYHTGVERKWWEGPDTCTSGSISGLSADDLLNQIMDAPLIRCDEVAWSLMGLSMASWNMILSALPVVLWVMAARRS